MQSLFSERYVLRKRTSLIWHTWRDAVSTAIIIPSIRFSSSSSKQLNKVTTKEDKDSVLLKSSENLKKKYLVPHVPNIDYISRKDIEVEKLFARERPLFLGSFPLNLGTDSSSKVKSLGEFLETLQQTASGEDAKNTQIKIINITDKDAGLENDEDGAEDGEILGNVTSGTISNIMEKLKGPQVNTLTLWEASVTGIAYKDEAFKKVPRSVLESLKPYKFESLNYGDFEKKRKKHKSSTGSGGRKKSLLVKKQKFRVYTSRINNAVGYVDLNDIPLFYQPPKLNDPFDTLGKHSLSSQSRSDNTNAQAAKNKGSGLVSTTPDSTVKNLENIRMLRRTHIMDLAGKYEFIKDDQSVLRTEIMKLNRFLSKEFEKLKNILIQNEFRNYIIPLYIYIDRSLVSQRMFKNYLKKMIMSHIEPLLETVCGAFPDPKQSEMFRKKVQIKLKNSISFLQKEIPSIYFTTDGIDCILNKSSVKGFGKIYWLKKSSRQAYIYNKKNSEKSYIIGSDQSSYIRRSGLKNMKYPIKLISEKFDDAFKRWEDYI